MNITQTPQDLINNDLYQVFLMGGRCSFPINFARHHWFVVNIKGKINRWEVLFQKDCCGQSWGHLYKNVKDPFQSLGDFTTKGQTIFKSKLVGYIEGDEGSEARRILDLIENSHEKYPHSQKYLLWGPNSNTYIQWVLNQFPEFSNALIWDGIGKKYKK